MPHSSVLNRLLALAVLMALGGSTAPAQNRRTFATSQAATMVVGQLDFSQTRPGAEAFEMGSPNGLAQAGNRLIVTDGGFLFSTPQNNRVLIFNDITKLGPGQAANVVIGQTGFGFTCGSDGMSSCSISANGQNGLNQIGRASCRERV